MKVSMFILLGAMVAATSFLLQTDKANTVTESLVTPAIGSSANGRDRLQPEQPDSTERYVAAITTTTGTNSVAKVAYSDLQTRIAPPPDTVLHNPLPYLYCEESNQFVFLYPSAGGDQYYRLRPAKRESYFDVFEQIVAGSRFPWALRLRGAKNFFINAIPENKQQFDYQVAVEQFESCTELAKLTSHQEG